MRLSQRAFLVLSIAASWSTGSYAQHLPVTTGAMAFSRVGNYFYIHSGATYGDVLFKQFFAFDLTKPWPQTAPVWISLPPGPYNGFHTGGYSVDNSTFMTFGQDTGADAQMVSGFWLHSYNIAAQSWTSINPAGLKDNSRRDFTAVTNPSANVVYILGGNAGFEGNISSNVIDTYDVGSGKLDEFNVSSTGPQGAYTYAAVWLASQHRMMVIGGQMGGGLSTDLWLYNPQIPQNAVPSPWTRQTSSTNFNHKRTSSCAASNADGSLVAVFGGYFGAVSDPNAYILDTKTWTWTPVPLPAGTKGRGQSACVIVDDTFIIWGGFYNNPSEQNGLPSSAEATLLLNIQSKQWLSSYTPSAELAKNSIVNNPVPPTAPNGSDGSTGGASGKSGFPTAAIGGIAAAAVILLLVGGFFLRRRNKRRQTERKPDTPEFGFAKEEEQAAPSDEDTTGKQSLDGPPRRPNPPPGDLSPALYDFDSSPLPIEARLSQQHQLILQQQQLLQLQELQDHHLLQLQEQHLQQLHEQYRDSPEQAYVAQQQYLQMIQQQQSSPQMSEAPSGGYSSYSTPSAVPLVASGQEAYQGMQSPAFSEGSVYYPPPPGSSVAGNRHLSFVPPPATSPADTYPYKVPADDIANSQPSSPAKTDDQYHDAFGMKQMSEVSSLTEPQVPFVNPSSKRLSAPQAYITKTPFDQAGAPQSIPE